MLRRIFFMLSMSVLASTAGFAQNINLLSSAPEEQENERANLLKTAGEAKTPPAAQIAFPMGATAGLATDSDDGANAGALLGFQLWKKNVGFLATFFSFSGNETISGTQRSFGSFLLNPTTGGTSFYVSGNRAWPVGKLFLGVSGRAGATLTTWAAEPTTGAQSVDGFVFYLAPSFLLSSPTFRAGEDGANEYQLGLEVGPSLRTIGGDLAQADAFLSAPEVLGVADHSYLGYEITFFARLNAAQPFIRITRFNAGTDIPGFTGTQAIIGVNVLSAVFKSAVKGS